jgi:hypothetical protein
MPAPVPEQLSKTIETLYRSESGRVLATLVRLLGDLDLAEEAMHEAFAAAQGRCSLGYKYVKFSGCVCSLLVLVRAGVSTADELSSHRRVRGRSGQMVRWNAGTERVKTQRHSISLRFRFLL